MTKSQRIGTRYGIMDKAGVSGAADLGDILDKSAALWLSFVGQRLSRFSYGA